MPSAVVVVDAVFRLEGASPLWRSCCCCVESAPSVVIVVDVAVFGTGVLVGGTLPRWQPCCCCVEPIPSAAVVAVVVGVAFRVGGARRGGEAFLAECCWLTELKFTPVALLYL